MESALAELWLVPAALVTEACLGYPQALYSRIAHPVVWLGRLIDGLERRWNRASRSDAARRASGVATVVIAAGAAALAGYALQAWEIGRAHV